jgi:hypothetical protein
MTRPRHTKPATDLKVKTGNPPTSFQHPPFTGHVVIPSTRHRIPNRNPQTTSTSKPASEQLLPPPQAQTTQSPHSPTEFDRTIIERSLPSNQTFKSPSNVRPPFSHQNPCLNPQDSSFIFMWVITESDNTTCRQPGPSPCVSMIFTIKHGQGKTTSKHFNSVEGPLPPALDYTRMLARTHESTVLLHLSCRNSCMTIHMVESYNIYFCSETVTLEAFPMTSYSLVSNSVLHLFIQ